MVAVESLVPTAVAGNAGFNVISVDAPALPAVRNTTLLPVTYSPA